MSHDKDTHITSRRGFLAGGALLGAGLLMTDTEAAAAPPASGAGAVLNSSRPDAPYELVNPSNQIYTACLQCNTGCGISCKLQDGVVTKIDGNPYNPWTLLPHLPYATHPEDAAPVDGSICPKGQAGLQTAYDPYRIRKVLKRAGKRGENKWITIPFEQAIREICEGGKLFAKTPGEENRDVDGLAKIMALRDPALSKAMAADVKSILDEKDKEKKKSLVEEFKTKHAEHLDKLIDPNHPDLGPKNNQIVVAWGRLKGGRGEIYRRFADSMGTANAHGHTTVCQGSLYFTCKAISDQYVDGKFSGGKKFYWQADTENSRFIFFVGANLFEANYPYNVTYGASNISSMQLFLCDMWARWFRFCIQITCSICVSSVCCFIGKMTLSKILSCDRVMDGAFFSQPYFQAPEEEMGQHAGCDVVMPPG